MKSRIQIPLAVLFVFLGTASIGAAPTMAQMGCGHMGGMGKSGGSGHSGHAGQSGDGASAAAGLARPVIVDGVQVVKIVIDEEGRYTPARFTVEAGDPVRLLVEQWSTSECDAELQIPALGVRRTSLPAGKVTQIEFTPTREGTFPITCGMDMSKGSIVVD